MVKIVRVWRSSSAPVQNLTRTFQILVASDFPNSKPLFDIIDYTIMIILFRYLFKIQVVKCVQINSLEITNNCTQKESYTLQSRVPLLALVLAAAPASPASFLAPLNEANIGLDQVIFLPSSQQVLLTRAQFIQFRECFAK